MPLSARTTAEPALNDQADAQPRDQATNRRARTSAPDDLPCGVGCASAVRKPGQDANVTHGTTVQSGECLLVSRTVMSAASRVDRVELDHDYARGHARFVGLLGEAARKEGAAGTLECGSGQPRVRRELGLVEDLVVHADPVSGHGAILPGRIGGDCVAGVRSRCGARPNGDAGSAPWPPDRINIAACDTAQVIVRRLAAALLVAVLVAGCTSSKPKPAASSSTASASATLAARLGAALNSLTSAHLAIDAGALGGTSTADVALSNGTVTGTDAMLTEDGVAVELLTVGGTSYAKIPAAANSSGKPWVVVSATSGNAIAKALATSAGVADITGSLSVIPGLVAGASALQDKGKDVVDGVSAEHYTMKIDPTKPSGSAGIDSLLHALGSTPVTVEVWVDAQTRPVKLVIDIALGSAAFLVSVSITKFDAPVTVTAPPAAQVSTS